MNAYLSRSTTNAVKGLFLALVFITHILGYYADCGVALPTWLDTAMHLTLNPLGQMVVVMFLFYSGYGVMCAIMAKGSAYVDAMPVKRILGVAANFAVAVLVFYVVRIAIGLGTVPPRTLVLSLIGWDSVGNSNWYIFDILILYLATYASFKVCRSHAGALAALALLCLATIAVLSLAKPYWWSDTLAAYPLGALLAYRRAQVEKAATHHYWLLFAGSLAVFAATYLVGHHLPILVHNVRSLAFAALVVLATMRLRFQPRALGWIGANLFPLYIYQRLPMMVLCTVGGGFLPRQYPVAFFILSAIITLGIALAYRFFEIKFHTYDRALTQR